MVVHALGKFMRGERLRMDTAQQKNGGQDKAAGSKQLAHAHCTSWVQLAPPVGSDLIVPNWSLQKPLSPVLPTVCGTPVTV